ncbi:CPBP family intramembrane glutamic endopeptidase [Spirochaeta africana]|uniref:Putative metal-dependent membrane protease n=1 Tax=Spirochaeta africana (strain ATCC 700263 / DSM 8902 / Z-7692) TaxID=889378 RepID=H9UG93_SPIAZ|nr:type II CAAX endopeptidase family protein [Spirochaeta africana]AFG36536.1 putative metal-dependent membrane protease [Spirochaeta africana DSM 8902]
MQEKSYPRVGDAIWLSFLYIVIMLVAAILLGIVVGMLSAVIGIREDAATVLENIGATVATVGALLFVFRRFTRNSGIKPMEFARRHSLSPAAVVGFIALTAGAIIISSDIHNQVIAVVPQPEWYTSAIGQLTGQPIVIALVTVAVIPAVIEEVMFRGFFTIGLRRHENCTTTIAASSLLFGLVHLNPWQFFPAAFIGVVLGWLALRTGSILLPIAAHFINNALAVLLTRSEYLLPIRGFHPAHTIPGIFQPFVFTLSGIALLAAGYAVLQRTLPPAHLRYTLSSGRRPAPLRAGVVPDTESNQ